MVMAFQVVGNVVLNQFALAEFFCNKRITQFHSKCTKPRHLGSQDGELQKNVLERQTFFKIFESAKSDPLNV